MPITRCGKKNLLLSPAHAADAARVVGSLLRHAKQQPDHRSPVEHHKAQRDIVDKSSKVVPGALCDGCVESVSSPDGQEAPLPWPNSTPTRNQNLRNLNGSLWSKASFDADLFRGQR